jgi:hypothetical protein
MESTVVGTHWGLTIGFQLKEHSVYLFYFFTAEIQYTDII